MLNIKKQFETRNSIPEASSQQLIGWGQNLVEPAFF